MTITESGYERKKNELYETPWNVTETLLRHLCVKNARIWEPAAGNHKIASMLLLSGAAGVITTDIEEYNVPHSNGLLDFTDPEIDKDDCIKIHHTIDMIITNPPYGKGNHLAAKFCRLALKRCNGFVAMFMTMGFDAGLSRTDLFRDNPRWWKKIVLLDRPAWFGDGGGTGDFAWYVWRPAGEGNCIATIEYERLTK